MDACIAHLAGRSAGWSSDGRRHAADGDAKQLARFVSTPPSIFSLSTTFSLPSLSRVRIVCVRECSRVRTQEQTSARGQTEITVLFLVSGRLSTLPHPHPHPHHPARNFLTVMQAESPRAGAGTGVCERWRERRSRCNEMRVGEVEERWLNRTPTNCRDWGRSWGVF